ncbi:MAG TPA: type I glyceraldehyde-3-phosphate dehydrogenase, partial [Perlabentimonas sp.]|nr:type I glyceraldehyde-3-phosphate dehydrogenase [Perlabentimonas sp.]
VRIGINGFGRIGKMFFRMLAHHPEIELVGINDLMDDDMLRYLLKYDTVHGRFGKEIKIANGQLHINGWHVNIGHHAKPSEIPWREWGVDIVIESSGHFTTRQDLQQHIEAGAKRVILSSPPTDELDLTLVIGVNDNKLLPEHKIVSNASCTANCVTPILHILNSELGIESAFLNTVHPYTNNQRIIDSPHPDFRRSRASADNIIPTSTSAVGAVHSIIPELKNRFNGISTRVPVICGALSELVVTFPKAITENSINKLIKGYAQGSMRSIIRYETDPIVSSDVLGCTYSCVFDSLATKVVSNSTAQLILWYDNEIGYSNRLVDLVLIMAKQMA